MGCDIHAYVEMYSKKDLAAGRCFVDTYASEINFGRNYDLFGLIAGVRSMSSPIVQPRGLPTNPPLSWMCTNEYFLRIVPDEEMNGNRSVYGRDLLGQKIISQSELDRINQTHFRSQAIIPNTENMIPNPDYHSLTWLTVNELCVIRKNYLVNYIEYYDEITGAKTIHSTKKKKDLINFINNKNEKALMKYSFYPYECPTLYATISTMMSLERCNEDIVSRFVCWFDS